MRTFCQRGAYHLCRQIGIAGVFVQRLVMLLLRAIGQASAPAAREALALPIQIDRARAALADRARKPPARAAIVGPGGLERDNVLPLLPGIAIASAHAIAESERLAEQAIGDAGAARFPGKRAARQPGRADLAILL